MHMQLKVLSEKKRACQNPYKLNIALATDSCSEGVFVERGVLIHPLQYCIVQMTLTLNEREWTYSIGLVNGSDADSQF